MTSISSELPREVEKHFLCKLLHIRTPIWDGTYRYDEISQEDVPNIRHICEICDDCEDDAE